MYAETGHALREALTALGGDCFVKSCRDGYDGRGQFRARSVDDATAAWEALGGAPCVAERALDLEAEASVMVARSPSGATAVYPPALNHHENRVLDWSVLPAALPAEVLSARRPSRATSRRRWASKASWPVFLTRGGELLVNGAGAEAPQQLPRDHGGLRDEPVSEQHVRAVCNLPLGSTALLRPAAIVNLLGDLWTFAFPASTARHPRRLASPLRKARRAPRTKDGAPHRRGRNDLRGHRKSEGRARGAPGLKRAVNPRFQRSGVSIHSAPYAGAYADQHRFLPAV